MFLAFLILAAIVTAFINSYLSFLFLIFFLFNIFFLRKKGKVNTQRVSTFIFVVLLFNFINIFYFTNINFSKFASVENQVSEEDYQINLLQKMLNNGDSNNPEFLQYLYGTIQNLEAKENKKEVDYLRLYNVYDIAARAGIYSAKDKARDSLQAYCQSSRDTSRCTFAY